MNDISFVNEHRGRVNRLLSSFLLYVRLWLIVILVTSDEIIRDHPVEKTLTARIRERLFLERELMLQKALIMAGQI